MRILALVTDAFGGRGGIAKFNRDLLTSFCAHPDVSRVTALPRVVYEAVGSLPPRLDYRTESASTKSQYVVSAARAAVGGGYDVVVCGHLNLLLVAAALATVRRVPLVVVAHEPNAELPAHRSPRDLEPFGLGCLDHLVIGHHPP
jgi:hypothetical protein